jgi:hypothetical protein
LGISRLLTRVDETRLRSQNAQISRPKEQIDSNDGLEVTNEFENAPSGAGESSNELLTSDRIANLTIQMQTSGELDNIACSPQNLWREPQALPNCKTQVYVYPYSTSVIQEDHLRRFPVVIDIFKRNIEEMSELKLHIEDVRTVTNRVTSIYHSILHESRLSIFAVIIDQSTYCLTILPTKTTPSRIDLEDPTEK